MDNKRYDNGEYLLDMARYDISGLVQKLFMASDDRIPDISSWDEITQAVTKLYEALSEYYEYAVLSATRAEICGGYTVYHSINVAMLSMYIGIAMGKQRKEVISLGIAGLLHDVGKKYISNPVIDKVSPLSTQEQEVFRMHPTLGYELIKSKYPEAPLSILRGILEHHERADGSGYPIMSSDISETARIVAVADVFEAFTAVRPYHNSRPLSEGFEHILKEDGLDTDIARIFVSVATDDYEAKENAGKVVYMETMFA